jgi:hypothetical protein
LSEEIPTNRASDWCYLCSGLGEVPSLVWVEGDAEKLEFKDNSMDGYTIAFGIRNVTHIDKALEEAYRYRCSFTYTAIGYMEVLLKFY